MPNSIEPDFKLLMLLHEMFADGKPKPSENKPHKKHKPHDGNKLKTGN